MPAKAHEPTNETRAQVEALSSFGTPQEDIAAYIGISKPTLAKHYDIELKLASIKATAEVGGYLFSLASGRALATGATHGDCKTAAMFWMKTRAGWREKQDVNLTSNDGPLTIHWKNADN